MTTTALTLVPLTADAPHRPLLVLGPSLGTATEALWARCAELLADEFQIVGWELPGHGRGPATTDPFSIGDLADGVVTAVDRQLPGRGDEAFHYAGDSIGGAVGLSLLLAHRPRVAAATLACTGARIGTQEGWRERAATVRTHGAAVMVPSSAERWFAPGFLDREPAAGAALLDVLRHADAESYALACEALATFDVRPRLSHIQAPLALVAGRDDQATSVAGMDDIAAAVTGAHLTVLDRVAHLAPIEDPPAVADAIRAAARSAADRRTAADARQAGMAVRRAVAGDAWVDRAEAATTDFTRDFQQFITQYAWGTVWTRPGLDRRSRSMITITALVAHGHHEELAMHIRAGLTNGLSREEVKEVLLHAAIYCGVPAANTAFRIAQRTFDEIDGPGGAPPAGGRSH